VKSSVLCCTRVIYYTTMPRSKQCKSCHSEQIIVQVEDDKFSTDGGIRKMCNAKAATEKRFAVQQCIGRDKHIPALQISSKKKPFEFTATAFI
jgi:hypothetical protein